ncbi:MAG: hypothetical protein ACPGAJ_07360 [Schleiferiaceae bacterium]
METRIKILSTVVLFTGLIACGGEEKPTEDHVISIEDASKEDFMDEDKIIVVSNDSEGPSEVSDRDIIMLEDAAEADLMDENKTIVVVADDAAEK